MLGARACERPGLQSVAHAGRRRVWRVARARLAELHGGVERSCFADDGISRSLEERLSSAKAEICAAEAEKHEKEQHAYEALREQVILRDDILKEYKILQQEAEENSKLQEFLMDTGRSVDSLHPSRTKPVPKHVKRQRDASLCLVTMKDETLDPKYQSEELDASVGGKEQKTEIDPFTQLSGPSDSSRSSNLEDDIWTFSIRLKIWNQRLAIILTYACGINIVVDVSTKNCLRKHRDLSSLLRSIGGAIFCISQEYELASPSDLLRIALRIHQQPCDSFQRGGKEVASRRLVWLVITEGCFKPLDMFARACGALMDFESRGLEVFWSRRSANGVAEGGVIIKVPEKGIGPILRSLGAKEKGVSLGQERGKSRGEKGWLRMR
ncbi:hypothetical protein AXF42_Ash016858 [Apostasia shenzhenica]|uniref:Uncharacterized protein n=1 Tax=Apostasia shenzhenica TaxID=1088818 RepID=A0A2I0BAK6_9ASPA|nr:hypothetical protein AXF42_Ash016858 [Apostasia shenzhenica]